MNKVELPSSDEIRKLYQAGEEPVVAVFEQLVIVIQQLEQRVQSLGDQLANKSHNSHKPPSSDSYWQGSKRVCGSRVSARSVGNLVMMDIRCKWWLRPMNANCIR